MTHLTLNSSFVFSEKVRGWGKMGVIVPTLLRFTVLTSHPAEPSQQHVFAPMLKAEVFSVPLFELSQCIVFLHAALCHLQSPYCTPQQFTGKARSLLLFQCCGRHRERASRV